ncbi:hypothetical protein CBL_08470 [Carabus blaptoides fortunei]
MKNLVVEVSDFDCSDSDEGINPGGENQEDGKEAKTARRDAISTRKNEEEQNLQIEGQLYGAGIADVFVVNDYADHMKSWTANAEQTDEGSDCESNVEGNTLPDDDMTDANHDCRNDRAVGFTSHPWPNDHTTDDAQAQKKSDKESQEELVKASRRIQSIITLAVEMSSLTSEDLRSRQIADTDLKKIIVALEDDPIELGRWMRRGYCLAKGVLYLLDDDREEPRLNPTTTKSESFLNKVVQKGLLMNSDSLLLEYFIEDCAMKISLHILSVKYMAMLKCTNAKLEAQDFINFCTGNMAEEYCNEAQIHTFNQSKTSKWFEARYARIAASKFMKHLDARHLRAHY